MVHLRTSRFLITIVCGLLCVPPAADAASFDCHRAHSTVERLICADSDLSELDTKISQTYAELRNTAPPGSQDRLQLLSEQRTFLHSRTEECPIPLTTELSEAQTSGIIDCLKTIHRQRLAAVETQLATLKHRVRTSIPDSPANLAAVRDTSGSNEQGADKDSGSAAKSVLLVGFLCLVVYAYCMRSVLRISRTAPAEPTAPAESPKVAAVPDDTCKPNITLQPVIPLPEEQYVYRNYFKVPKLAVDLPKSLLYVYKSQHDLKGKTPHRFGRKEKVAKVIPIRFQDLVSCQAVVTRLTVEVDKSDSPITRALIAGVLFGPTGALIGAATAEERVESRTTGYIMDLKITTSDLANHLQVIHFWDPPRPLSEKSVKKAATALEHWRSLINTIIQQRS